MSLAHPALIGGTVDCGRFSPDNASAECEERGETALGVFVVVALVLLVVGWACWRWLLRRHRGREGNDADR